MSRPLPNLIPRQVRKPALAVLLAAGVALAGFGPAATPTSRPGPAKANDELGADAGRPRADVYGDPLPPGALARMGTVRFRLPYTSFEAAAFTPDGKTLA